VCSKCVAGRRLPVAVCCSVLQCVAVCCNVLQCVADMILRVASVYTQGVAGCCSVLQCAEVCRTHIEKHENSYGERGDILTYIDT